MPLWSRAQHLWIIYETITLGDHRILVMTLSRPLNDLEDASARGGRGCSSEILNLTPKGDHLGVAQAFCDP